MGRTSLVVHTGAVLAVLGVVLAVLGAAVGRDPSVVFFLALLPVCHLCRSSVVVQRCTPCRTRERPVAGTQKMNDSDEMNEFRLLFIRSNNCFLIGKIWISG